MFGIDYEVLVSKKTGIQVGAGLIGFGAGLNFHFKPRIHSSFFSIQYYNQGIRGSFVQNLIGPSFVIRRKKWLSMSFGAAAILSKGERFAAETRNLPPVLLTFSFGKFIID